MNRAQICQEAFRRFEGSFSYGEKDCCQVAGWVVEQATGKNPMSEFAYSSQDEAEEIIAQEGGLEQAITNRLGEPLTGPYRDGDVVLVRMPIVGDAVALWFSGAAVVPTEKQRFLQLPASYAITGWRY